MTDEQMDAWLRRAGEQWGAAAPTSDQHVHEIEPAEVLDLSPSRPNHRRTMIASAAVVVAALIAGVTLLVGGRSGHTGDTGADVPLRGTVWRLVSTGGRPDPNSLSTLYIDGKGALVADDSCEVVAAKVKSTSTRLQASELEVRSRDCIDSAGERTFSGADALLSARPRYSIHGHELKIGGLRFAAAPELLPPTLDVPTFLGARWQLIKATDASGTDRPVERPVTFVVNGDRLTTSDGCNGFTGTVRSNGSAFTVHVRGLTQVGCSTADVVDAVLLHGDPRQAVRGTQLTIINPGAGTLVYRWLPDDAAATDPAKLVGTAWRLRSVAGDPAVADAGLRLDTGGRLTVDDGCSEFTATAEVAPGTFATSGAPPQPRPLCEQPAAGQAATIDSFLSTNPVLWAIRDGKLLVYGGGAQAFALVYSAGAPATPPISRSPLIGERWTLTGTETATTTGGSGVADPTSLVLTFDRAGYRLAERCRDDVGRAQLGPHTIRFSGARHSDHSCPALDPQRNRTEADAIHLVHSTLSGSVHWTLAGGVLTLSRNGTTLTFSS